MMCDVTNLYGLLSFQRSNKNEEIGNNENNEFLSLDKMNINNVYIYINLTHTDLYIYILL